MIAAHPRMTALWIAAICLLAIEKPSPNHQPPTATARVESNGAEVAALRERLRRELEDLDARIAVLPEHRGCPSQRDIGLAEERLRAAQAQLRAIRAEQRRLHVSRACETDLRACL